MADFGNTPLRRKMPVQARSRARVDAILQATSEIVSESGLTTVTTKRVARRAGVSIGSVYQYFTSKEGLISELVATALDRLEEVIATRSAAFSASSLDEAVDMLIDDVTEAWDETRWWRLSRAAERFGMEPRYRAFVQSLERIARDLLMMHLPSISEQTRRQTARVLVNAIGATLQALSEDEADKETLKATAGALARGYLNEAIVDGA